MGYVTPNGRMPKFLRLLKDEAALMHHASILMEGRRKILEHPSLRGWIIGSESNLVFPKHNPGMATVHSRRFVVKFSYMSCSFVTRWENKFCNREFEVSYSDAICITYVLLYLPCYHVWWENFLLSKRDLFPLGRISLCGLIALRRLMSSHSQDHHIQSCG
jgi:hypothetical protein